MSWRPMPEACMHAAGGGNRARRRAHARRNGRLGGLASGKRRRELARGRRHARRRTRQTALALAYKQRQLSRQQFGKLYFKVRPSGKERGLETAWKAYEALFTVYRCEGQHYRTTNGQRGAALAGRGRARCRRTVQRSHRLLEEMGLAVVSHYKDQRDRPGHKDCLVVEIRSPVLSRRSKCHPAPSGQQKAALRAELSAAVPRKELETTTGPDSIPPPAAADDDGGAPAGAERPGTEREWIEGRIRFAEMKLEAGFATASARARLLQLRAELRCLSQATEPSASDPAPPED